MNKSSIEAHTNVHEFVNLIAEEVRKGYGIIPLTGAGISVAAGIPSGHELQSYLATLIDTNKAEEEMAREEDRRDPFKNAGFNCLKDPWPPIDRDHITSQKTGWSADYMLLLADLASRMRLPTQQVFDSFFTFLMRDKEPVL